MEDTEHQADREELGGGAAQAEDGERGGEAEGAAGEQERPAGGGDQAGAGRRPVTMPAAAARRTSASPAVSSPAACWTSGIRAPHTAMTVPSSAKYPASSRRPSTPAVRAALNRRPSGEG
ncbi:hypothetical protein CQR58_041995 [Streptomyces acidiscabies]